MWRVFHLQTDRLCSVGWSGRGNRDSTEREGCMTQPDHLSIKRSVTASRDLLLQNTLETQWKNVSPFGMQGFAFPAFIQLPVIQSWPFCVISYICSREQSSNTEREQILIWLESQCISNGPWCLSLSFTQCDIFIFMTPWDASKTLCEISICSAVFRSMGIPSADWTSNQVGFLLFGCVFVQFFHSLSQRNRGAPLPSSSSHTTNTAQRPSLNV